MRKYLHYITTDPNTISAKNNCWIEDGKGTLAEAEGVIFHIEDNPTLGEVIFDPAFCDALVGIEDRFLQNFVFYPSPAIDVITFNNNILFHTLDIYDLHGKRVYSKQVSQGINSITINLPEGMYFASFSSDENKIVRNLLVK